ncbi:restriction endonuclease subunit S [Bradyrhizobium japonicum]|uniref:restriction endonuclease subunit S n=1 Tax=Bradyrhizobium japonicum TaxID=375 RepID=UPI0004ADAD20|nr:restriction endonuclease subunit S [Bradyrhizobium japonicum]
MSVPQYKRYKGAAMEGVRQLPEHWELIKLKRVAQIRYGIGEPPSYREEGIPLIRATNVDAGRITKKDLVLVDPTDIPEKRIVWLSPGDIIVVRSGAYTGDSAIIRLHHCPCIAGFDMVVTPRSCSPDYLQYALLSSYLKRDQIDLEKLRAAQPHLNAEELGDCTLLLPPEEEQLGIISFLDRETSKLDALVAEQQRLIELLKEKRQTVVSHAVTKGLDRNARTKDSGVEWLREVPEHWECRSISSISTKITNGYVGPTRDILVDEGVRYLQSLHIKNNSIRFDNPYFVRHEWSMEHSKSILGAGDVLIVQTGDIGQVAVVTEEFAGCNCHALIIVAPIKDVVSGDWLAWTLNSDYGFNTLLSIQTGALHPHLNCGNVKGVMVPVPPLEEQGALPRWSAESENSTV